MAKPTVRLRRLGSQLRQLREHAGMSCKDAGDVLHVTMSTISRLELGERTIRPPDLNALLDAYGVSDKARRNGLIQLAVDARRRDWFSEYEDILGEPFRGYLSLENEATSIRYYHPQCVPGLLQTDAYAEIVLAQGPDDSDTIERMVEVRKQRRAILARENPPSVSVVIDEQAVRRPIGGRGVLRDQVRYLLSAAQASNIDIRVLPQSLEAGLVITSGSFVILSFPEAGVDAVFLENLMGGNYLDTDAAIHTYGVAFDQLREAALDREASLKLLTAVDGELGRDG